MFNTKVNEQNMKNEKLNAFKMQNKTFYSIKHYSQCTDQGGMFKTTPKTCNK